MAKKIEDVAKDVAEEISGTQYVFKKIGDKIDRGVCIVIYSNPGIGKTTLSATLPVEETLIINCESGVGPLLGTGHYVFNVNADNVTELERLYEELRTGKLPFKYVVLDNISQLEQWYIMHYTQTRDKEFPELREYGDTGVKMREQLTRWRDLTESGITVVMNAWEMTMDVAMQDGYIRTLTLPKMMRKVAPDVCGIVDMVGHLEVHEKSGKRWVRFGPSDQYLTKTQFKGIDAGEVADMPTLLEKVYGHDYGQTS